MQYIFKQIFIYKSNFCMRVCGISLFKSENGISILGVDESNTAMACIPIALKNVRSNVHEICVIFGT